MEVTHFIWEILALKILIIMNYEKRNIYTRTDYNYCK